MSYLKTGIAHRYQHYLCRYVHVSAEREYAHEYAQSDGICPPDRQGVRRVAIEQVQQAVQ